MDQIPTDMTAVAVKDELGETIVKEQRESLIREIKQYEEAIVAKEKDKANYAEQSAIAKRAREIQAKGLRKTPEHVVWEYEKDPEFWKCQDQLVAFKHRQENQVDEGTLKRYDYEIEQLKKRIAESQDALDKLDGE